MQCAGSASSCGTGTRSCSGAATIDVDTRDAPEPVCFTPLSKAVRSFLWRRFQRCTARPWCRPASLEYNLLHPEADLPVHPRRVWQAPVSPDSSHIVLEWHYGLGTTAPSPLLLAGRCAWAWPSGHVGPEGATKFDRGVRPRSGCPE